MPETTSWIRSAMVPLRARCGTAARSRPHRWSRRLLRAERRQRLDDDLLAVHDLGQEALAVDVAVLVERDVHQHARGVLRRDLRAVHRRGERLAVDLADLLGDRLDDVHAGVALEPVVVRAELELA